MGYDLQMVNWVLGAQASFAVADLTGSHLFLDGTGPTNWVHYDIKYLGTLSGRIGYTVTPDALVYLKGGGAWARTNYEDSVVLGLNYRFFGPGQGGPR